MASNFKILLSRNKQKLHLKLMGNFDGSSAYELINTIKHHCGKNGKIVVHTGGLAVIHPFGLSVFHKNWAISKKESRSITFAGKHGSTLAPPGSGLQES